MKLKVLLMGFLLIAAGCSQKIEQPMPVANQQAALMNPPVETYPEPAVRNEGSLFSDDSRLDLFADAKARRVGDIITVNIVENSKANKNVATNTSRKSSINAKTDALMGWENSKNIPLIGNVFDSIDLDPSIGIDANYNSGFSGSGSTNRNENVTAKMSARVVQVLPNGNMVVRGTQEIMVNNEKQYIAIQGVVRPDDIGSDNTVLSTYIADARIDYNGKGDLSRKQREGWLTRFFDSVWPF